MYSWLVIHLNAPLMSFGGIAIDQVGPTREFPAISMLVGLFANAFGWHWSDYKSHQMLQNRLVFAVRRDCDGHHITDTQNVKLSKSDRCWTTRGQPEGRSGGSYDAPHRRQRDYLADASLNIVVRFDPEEDEPKLTDLAHALVYPARPLFFGRKPCLPSMPLISDEQNRWVQAETAYSALLNLPGVEKDMYAQWPFEQGPNSSIIGADSISDLSDLKNWQAGFHAGTRRVIEGRVKPVVSK